MSQESPCAVWDVTVWRVPTDDRTEYVDALKAHCRALFKHWVFQVEACPRTGTLHLQLRGSLYKKLREDPAKALILARLAPCEISRTSNGGVATQFNYCMKDDSRVEGPWTDKDPVPPYIPRQYRGLLDRLYPYQRQIHASLDVFDSRTINLIFDPSGNHGKSTIGALCALHYGCLRPPPLNDSKDLLQYCCDVLISKDQRRPKAVFFDLPRPMDKTRLRGLLTAIEEIKNGYCFDTRNHFREWWFDSPACWVFTNVEIDMTLLSADRWVRWTISERKELVPVVPVPAKNI